eukprot:1182617-Rhodomonas_salina.1
MRECAGQYTGHDTLQNHDTGHHALAHDGGCYLAAGPRAQDKLLPPALVVPMPVPSFPLLESAPPYQHPWPC